MCQVAILTWRCALFALYQMTVVYGGRHLVRVFPGAPRYVVSSIWLHLISLVTVDWTGGLGDTQCLCAISNHCYIWGRHIARCSVLPFWQCLVLPKMFVWLHLINPVTVYWTGGSGTRSACELSNSNWEWKRAKCVMQFLLWFSCQLHIYTERIW